MFSDSETVQNMQPFAELEQLLFRNSLSFRFRVLGKPAPLRAASERVVPAKTLFAALPTPPDERRIDDTLVALAGFGAISSPSEEGRIEMLGHTVLLLELEIELASLVLYSVLLGLPLEGIVTAAAAASDGPFIAEFFGGQLRESELLQTSL